uniref:Secreted protein n=1 Tax=Anopheles stephensi TaxID=30069 RepID=A0A182YEH9_ANOST
MEIRWMHSIQLVLLLTLTTIPIIRATSSKEQKQHESLGNSPSVASASSKWDSSPRVESDTHPDSGHFRLVDDELIGARAATESSPSSSFTHSTQPKKRLLGKESKKYRKKYVSEDDYRKSMPHADAPQSADGVGSTGEKQTTGTSAKSSKPHSRKKRLIWVTDDGRLALPPGTSLTIAPTIALPFVRYPPTGFLSNISISLPITIDFDKLGLTDNQNPLGVLPPLFARSMGQAAGSVLADYVSDYMRLQRRKRSIPSTANDHFKITTNRLDDEDGGDQSMPQLPAEHKHAFHGGERALLYVVVEDFIANFGLDGRACMLRAICEVHSKSIEKFGLIGEMLKLFFTASLSPYSEHLDEYVTAEKVGRGQDGPGECFPYYKDCPRSLFRSSNNPQHMYQQPEQRHRPSDFDRDVDDEEHFDNEIPGDPVREPRATSSSRNSNTKENTIVQLEQRDLAEMAM